MYLRLKIDCTHLQAFSLPFVPESYNTIVRRATGYHVISVCLYAVQSAVMRLLPLHHTRPVGKDGSLRMSSDEQDFFCLFFAEPPFKSYSSMDLLTMYHVIQYIKEI